MIETEGLTGADTLLRVLSHMGVDRIFASPGSEWSPVWEAFAKAKARSEGVPLYISSRHEEIAVGMASGEGALGHGWVREDEVRATLSAIEDELALALRPPRKLAGSRLLRLRLLLLLAVESSDLPLKEALRSLRAALRGPLPPLA